MAKGDEAKPEEEGTQPKGRSKKKLILMVLPVLLVVAAGVWFFLLKGDSGPTALPEPTPGPVLKVDAITINLAGGHFLKFGMALQPTATAHEVDGSKALDLAITQFSGKTIDELSSADGRDKSKAALIARIKLAYLPHGSEEVMAKEAEKAAEKAAEKSGSKKKEAAKTEAPTDAHAEEHDEDLTDAEAIAKADKLTVQPEVYDLYFTEFVMQ